MNGGMLVLPDFTEHGGLAGAVGTNQSHLFTGVNGKGNGFQQGVLEGQGIVVQSQQFNRLFRCFHFGQTDLRLADFYKGSLDMPALQVLQIADLALQGTADGGVDEFGSIIPQPLDQLGDALHLLFALYRSQLQVDFLLQTGVVVLCKIALKLLQITVFQMPDPIEAMGQQIAAVGNHQQGALVGVDQIPETVQIFEVQENVRFVHNQQTGMTQHLADDLNQLQLAAAELLQLQGFLGIQLGQLQLTTDIEFVIICVHGIAFVQQILVALHQSVHIVGLAHLHADIVDGFFQSQEILTQVVVNGDGLIAFTDGELADIADTAHTVQGQFAVENVVCGILDQVHQGGFAGAVAADQGAMAVFFQLKGNILD